MVHEFGMPYTRRVILHAPPWNAQCLVNFVEASIRDGVALVAVVGNDCQRVEDVIDELVVAAGFDDTRFINTFAHPGETMEEVRAFVATWTLGVDPDEPVQEIRLTD